MKPGRRRKKTGTANPIRAKQTELERAQEEIRRKMQKLEALLADAPRRAQELQRRRQEESVARATGRHRPLDVSWMVNVSNRRSHAGSTAQPLRKLRKERQQQKLQFAVLCLLLLVLLYFVSSLVL